MTSPRILFCSTRENRCSVAALAAAVEDTPGLDHEGFRVEELAALLEGSTSLPGSRDPTILALSLSSPGFLAHLPLLRDLSRHPARSSLRIIAGGPHPTARPEQVLEAGVDAVVVGEGEAAIGPLALALLDRGELPPGVVTLREGEAARTDAPSTAVDLEQWRPHPRSRRLIGPVEISRGCGWGCTFCQTPRLHPRPWGVRHRSPAAVAKAVRQMVRQGAREIRFISPNFLAYGSRDGRRPEPDALEALLEAVRHEAQGRSIHAGVFPGEVRPDFVTPDTVRILQRYGDNRYVAFGAQSGSDAMLRRMGRGHSAAHCLAAADLLRSAGMGVMVDILFGMPGETEEDVQANLALQRRLVRSGCRTRSHVFLPLPGTPLEHAPPGTISELTQRTLTSLERGGVEHGPWRSKKELAPRLKDLDPRRAVG